MFDAIVKDFKESKRVVDFRSILECSEAIHENCPKYLHSPYQSFAAAVAISSHSSVRIIEMPTGSGKTWVYSIIAKHHSG